VVARSSLRRILPSGGAFILQAAHSSSGPFFLEAAHSFSWWRTRQRGGAVFLFVFVFVFVFVLYFSFSFNCGFVGLWFCGCEVFWCSGVLACL
jgi:hypothetical protein